MTEIIFEDNEDWEKRTLCSDESCIGTIGSDGNCKECGRPYNGVLPITTAPSCKVAGLQDKQETVDKKDIISDDEWEKRILCGDESCIGVIGLDGLCSECGKPLKQ
jgi:hypothetical protein